MLGQNPQYNIPQAIIKDKSLWDNIGKWVFWFIIVTLILTVIGIGLLWYWKKYGKGLFKGKGSNLLSSVSNLIPSIKESFSNESGGLLKPQESSGTLKDMISTNYGKFNTTWKLKSTSPKQQVLPTVDSIVKKQTAKKIKIPKIKNPWKKK